MCVHAGAPTAHGRRNSDDRFSSGSVGSASFPFRVCTTSPSPTRIHVKRVETRSRWDVVPGDARWRSAAGQLRRPESPSIDLNEHGRSDRSRTSAVDLWSWRRREAVRKSPTRVTTGELFVFVAKPITLSTCLPPVANRSRRLVTTKRAGAHHECKKLVGQGTAPASYSDGLTIISDFEAIVLFECDANSLL